MSKPMVQLSVTNFHFVKPALIKHVPCPLLGRNTHTQAPVKRKTITPIELESHVALHLINKLVQNVE